MFSANTTVQARMELPSSHPLNRATPRCYVLRRLLRPHSAWRSNVQEPHLRCTFWSLSPRSRYHAAIHSVVILPTLYNTNVRRHDVRVGNLLLRLLGHPDGGNALLSVLIWFEDVGIVEVSRTAA